MVEVLTTRTKEILVTGGTEEILRVTTEALLSALTTVLVSVPTEDDQWSAKTAVMAWYPLLLIEAQLGHQRSSCMTSKGTVDSIWLWG